MIDEQKLKDVLSAVLGVPAESIGEGTNADTVESWGSLEQLNLILALEEEFGVEIPDEEAADLTSYPLIKLVVSEQVEA